MFGRRLSELEIASYDLVPPEVAGGARVARIPFVPGGYAGITLGRLVLLARPTAADGNSALLAHELIHVRQWTEQGGVRFLATYLSSFCRNLTKHRRWGTAYHAIEAEVEAREATAEWLRRRRPDLI